MRAVSVAGNASESSVAFFCEQGLSVRSCKLANEPLSDRAARGSRYVTSSRGYAAGELIQLGRAFGPDATPYAARSDAVGGRSNKGASGFALC